jgi:HD-GYP domain-containing protein (c-di-GMP phosphodiesterase class II)
MRDVLKSVRDIKRPGQDMNDPAPEKNQEGGGLRFPGPATSKPETKPMSMPDVSTPSAPKSEDVIPQPEDNPLNEASQSDLSPYHRTINEIDNFLQLVKSEAPFDLDEIAKCSAEFVDMLKENDQLFLQALSARKTVTTMAQHSANVAIVAIKVAYGLNYSRDKIIEVGIAGMIHEVGMTRIPDEVINKKGELSPSEYEKIKQHPIFGRQILDAIKDEYPELPDVVSQEHERWNGNGYPFGLSGDGIHEHAQILGLADTFVALTHVRHYRDNFIAYKAIQSIIERRNTDFSARMIKSLIDVISIFPVQSLVKLNNGSIARVVKTNKQFPVRPVIEMVANARGEKFNNPEKIDLSNEPMIYIVSPVLDENAYS